MSLNVVVTGSRDWPETERDLIVSMLDGLWWEATVGHLSVEMSRFNLFVGDAKGVDAIARWWGEQSPTHSYNETPDDPWFALYVFEANWKLYGHAAGPIRNATMLNAAEEGVVLAFHTNRAHYLKEDSGTNGCANKARLRGTFEVYDVIGGFDA
jgi:hypothetical protein